MTSITPGSRAARDVGPRSVRQNERSLFIPPHRLYASDEVGKAFLLKAEASPASQPIPSIVEVGQCCREPFATTYEVIAQRRESTRSSIGITHRVEQIQKSLGCAFSIFSSVDICALDSTRRCVDVYRTLGFIALLSRVTMTRMRPRWRSLPQRTVRQQSCLLPM